MIDGNSFLIKISVLSGRTSDVRKLVNGQVGEHEFINKFFVK